MSGEGDRFPPSFLGAFTRLCARGARAGFHERNGGNASMRLADSDVAQLRARVLAPGAWQTLEEGVPELAGAFLAITAAGSYMANVERDPRAAMGVVEVSSDGSSWRSVWGLEGGGRPSSELEAHMASHAARLRVGGVDRVLYHAHPSALVALSALLPADARALTRTLWMALTESAIAFPGGVGFLEWMVPGSPELARATARALERYQACVWQLHGIFAAGPDCESVFGLVEAVEKAADVHLRACSAARAGKTPRRLSAVELRLLARAHGLELNEDFLE